ncbi:MAG: hypothetical protein V7647_1530 [Acidobacteriota bacterium]
MLKNTPIFTIVCLIVSLWPATHIGTWREGESRHIAGLDKAAVLVTTARVRDTGGSVHDPEPGIFARHTTVAQTSGASCPAVFPRNALPSLRLATHLSI